MPLGNFDFTQLFEQALPPAVRKIATNPPCSQSPLWMWASLRISFAHPESCACLLGFISPWEKGLHFCGMVQS